MDKLGNHLITRHHESIWKAKEKEYGFIPYLWVIIIVGGILYNVLFPVHGDVLYSPDGMNNVAYMPFAEKCIQDKVFPLWLPYIFGGMPAVMAVNFSAPKAAWDIMLYSNSEISAVISIVLVWYALAFIVLLIIYWRHVRAWYYVGIKRKLRKDSWAFWVFCFFMIELVPAILFTWLYWK